MSGCSGATGSASCSRRSGVEDICFGRLHIGICSIAWEVQAIIPSYHDRNGDMNELEEEEGNCGRIYTQ